MGVVVTLEGLKFYYEGDTDFIEPMKTLRKEAIDVAFVPIGGNYTMDVDDAVEAVVAIAPRTAVPVHFNDIPGIQADPDAFQNEVEEKTHGTVQVVIL
jgi:L-ascorbate metabolism protein UlaG (beta-lactamase superfamily)